MNKKNIPIFVSHSGCPHSCIFCNQKKISGVHTPKEIADAKKIIEDALVYIDETVDVEIAFFGGSFTGIEEKRQMEYLKLANKYNAGIRLSTRPDYINDHILSLLKKYNVTTIELGVQSMVDSVLSLNERGMTAKNTIDAVKKIREYGFKLGLQMMTALYGSDHEKDCYTANKIIELEPDFVRIYPTVVIEDTKLYTLYKSGSYQIKTLEETVSLCTEIYTLFAEKNIPVIRLGLMASGEMNTDKVIGAYHPAFGELVMTRYYYEKIRSLTQSRKGNTLVIKAPANLKSKIIGHKKENIEKLKKEYQNIYFIDADEIGVEICER